MVIVTFDLFASHQVHSWADCSICNRWSVYVTGILGYCCCIIVHWPCIVKKNCWKNITKTSTKIHLIPWWYLHSDGVELNCVDEIVWLDAGWLRGDCPIQAIASKLCIDIGCKRFECVVDVPFDIGLVDVSDDAPFIPVRCKKKD